MMEKTKFFDKKKRDFSNKSNDEDDSKRPRVFSLDNSIVNSRNSDFFNESLKSEKTV